ncbi:hypothetical protein HYFRA_00010130 [Hymenoscyphus fraxineus]|uniref:Uncharacterized protein n=1 Tax=Hymenoscyphus fraxineus TaxID=746836 RepID=A0A9N9KVH9_9HELO|nr:hypothetical protein HYFRA_00010130 [Hymenoscyphus fraxineus]
MLFKTTTIAAIVALLESRTKKRTPLPNLMRLANYMTKRVCTGYDSNSGKCTGTCEEFDISVNQEINVPQTACIFNAASDTGFDALICSAESLGGSCSLLSTRRRVTITGDFNWDAGQFTRSMQRTGN